MGRGWVKKGTATACSPGHSSVENPVPPLTSEPPAGERHTCPSREGGLNGIVGDWQGWSGLEHQDLWAGAPGRKSGMPQLHTKDLASMPGRYPRGTGHHWTGPCEGVSAVLYVCPQTWK